MGTLVQEMTAVGGWGGKDAGVKRRNQSSGIAARTAPGHVTWHPLQGTSERSLPGGQGRGVCGQAGPPGGQEGGWEAGGPRVQPQVGAGQGGHWGARTAGVRTAVGAGELAQQGVCLGGS